MNRAIDVPCDTAGQFHLPFPDRCVYCGRPKETEIDWKIQGTGRIREPGASKPTTRFYTTDQRVPYCGEHAAAQRRYNALARRLQIVVTLGLGLPAGLGAFWILHRNSIIEHSVEIALLVWLGITVLLWFGVDKIWRTLSKTAADQRDLLGIGARFSPDGGTLSVTILNADIAKEFAHRCRADLPFDGSQ
jgi:hypothetical protein